MTQRTLAYSRAYLDRENGDGLLVFTASSEVLNRHGFSLRHDGWRLANFAANPVVLWMHNAFQPPIGRASASKQNKRVMAEVTFDRDDELARTVESKFRRGFLNAVSVGLDFVDEDGAALNWWSMSSEQLATEAFYDLAEISAVTVPADPTAVVENKRLALAALGRELLDLFDEQRQPEPAVTAAQIQTAVAAELTRLGITPLAEAVGIDKQAASAVFAAFSMEGTPVA